MELKANETDKLIKGMNLKPTDDTIKYDWNTEAHSSPAGAVHGNRWYWSITHHTARP